MTEKQLLHKRERKARRRQERKKDLAAQIKKMNPIERQILELEEEVQHLETMQVGSSGLTNLIARSEDVHEQRMAKWRDRDS